MGTLQKPGALNLIPFHGGVIEALEQDGTFWVVVKRVCENLGIADQAQAAKLKTKAWAWTTMIVVVAADGKAREVFCLSVRSLAMWLASIHITKVREALRPALESYQREAADVLYHHFLGRAAAAPPVPVPAAPRAAPVPPPPADSSVLAKADSAALRAELAALRADLAQLPALRAEVAAARAEIVAVRSLASEALEREVSTEEMADRLGVPLSAFKSMIRRDDALAALGLPLDQQLGHRWRPSQVRAHLEQRAAKRGRSAQTAGKVVDHV